ncbi:histone H4 transcription factor [Episyrphus balteatus]|uniref:histone H4 transcription factor n=1 Tax=Episyrphus balteatus TaxID=286459 RepID=UPI002485F09D|nr:histone H4 transcription factor [Episyrphus balteatus]
MPNFNLRSQKTVVIPRPKLVTRPAVAVKDSPKIENETQDTKKHAFCCNWKKCTEELSSSLELDQHLRKHLENIRLKAPYTCKWNSCNFSCTCSTELQRHVYYHGYHSTLLNIGRVECKKAKIPDCAIIETNKNSLPELKHNFECHWVNCNRNFVSVIEFQNHVALHSSFDYDMLRTHEENMPKARCNWQYCKKIFNNKYRLTEHTRMHSNQKLFGCFNCGELFRTKTTLFDHCRRQESNNTHKYQCGQCFKFYATEKLLRNHVVTHVNCLKCSMCDMTCNSSNALATHIRYRHLKDRPIRCPDCDYSCVTKSDLAKHKRHIHIKCTQRCGEAGCSYTVKSYHSLRKHYLEVHANSPSIYLCHCCDKLFKYGNLLSKHLIAKHKFQLPSGHKRFTYRIDENGFYVLETTRIESLEVTRQILSPVMFEVSELTEDSNCEVVNNETTSKSKQDSLQQLVTITLDDED